MGGAASSSEVRPVRRRRAISRCMSGGRRYVRIDVLVRADMAGPSNGIDRSSDRRWADQGRSKYGSVKVKKC